MQCYLLCSVSLNSQQTLASRGLVFPAASLQSKGSLKRNEGKGEALREGVIRMGLLSGWWNMLVVSKQATVFYRVGLILCCALGNAGSHSLCFQRSLRRVGSYLRAPCNRNRILELAGTRVLAISLGMCDFPLSCSLSPGPRKTCTLST